MSQSVVYQPELHICRADSPDERGWPQSDSNHSKTILDESRIPDDLEQGEEWDRHPHSGKEFLQFLVSCNEVKDRVTWKVYLIV